MNKGRGKTTDSISAWLLTREWYDRAAGLELIFWAKSDLGPIRIVIKECLAVCFAKRSSTHTTAVNRKPVALKTLDNSAVDALYFPSQTKLNEFSSTATALGQTLYESDIKPCDRYLMERFITGACQIQGTPLQCDGYIQYTNPKLKSADYRPNLRTLSFDIETNYHTDAVLSVAGQCYSAGRESAVVFIVSDDYFPPSDSTIYRNFPDEKTLLKAFLAWVQELDPDILCGWNVVNFDLMQLQKRCVLYGIPLMLSRAGKHAAILPGYQNSQNAFVRISGRVVLDGIDCLKSAFWRFESFALENVARELLGKGKLIDDHENRAEGIITLYNENKKQLADYNLMDCQLVREIFDHADLLNFCLERSASTGLALGRAGGSVAAFDFLYLPQLHRKGFVAPNINNKQVGGLGSPGGYVMDSCPGLFDNVLVLDYKSLYPSIIRTFLIDPLGMYIPSSDKVPGYDGADFDRNNAILPDLIHTLWNKRDLAKKSANAPMSQAVKIIMNSFYGVLGSSGCRFYDPKLTSSITKRGHDIIIKTRELIEAKGYKVIYGDTDSVFVWLEGNISTEQAKDTGRELQISLNSWWKDHVQTNYGLKCHLELEFETHFERFLMPTMRGSSLGSKKRYAGVVTNVMGEKKIIFKGLETVRTDWTPLAREFQRELFELIFADRPFEAYIRNTVEKMFNGELDAKLRYRKRIRQDLDTYIKNVPPHIQAARQLPKAGRWIEYHITQLGPQPSSQVDNPLDYEHYQEKQLKPVADTILQFVGYNFDDIISGQMEFF